MMSSSGTLRATTDADDRQVPWESHQIMLILCGLVGSGKSTFAADLQRHFPQFIRCNQDDLGTRHDVEHLARNALQDGSSVCIDRTNFDASQRSHWIEIARTVPGTLIWLIVFDTPYETCAARLRQRTEHPTIKTPEEGLTVLARFANDFQNPHPDEGYHRIIHLNSQGQPSCPAYSRSDVHSILQRLWNSEPVTPIGIPWSSSPAPQRWNWRRRGNSYFRYRYQ